MNSKVQARCDLLADNMGVLQKGFLFENALLRIISASIFAEGGKNVDTEYLKECRNVLRKNEGSFSNFRGINELIVATKMAQVADPESYILDVSEVYKKLKNGKLCGTRYMSLAAMSIVDAKRTSDADGIIEKGAEILKGMKSKHPFLTSEEDICFVELLAMSDKSTEDILSELEESYQILKKSFSFHDNAVYSLAQVLTLEDGDVSEKASKVVELFNALKDAGVKYGKDYELASLGALIKIDISVSELAEEIAETSKYLKTKKGFGILHCGEKSRHLFAALVVAGVLSEDNAALNASVVEGALSVIIAQEVALLSSMIAASAVAASSSSSH